MWPGSRGGGQIIALDERDQPLFPRGRQSRAKRIGGRGTTHRLSRQVVGCWALDDHFIHPGRLQDERSASQGFGRVS